MNFICVTPWHFRFFMPSFTPKQIAAQTIATLQSQTDARVAQQARAFFKPNEQLEFYGVKTPVLRTLTNQFYAQVRDTWQLDETLTCCELLINEREHESRIVGILLLARFRKKYSVEMRVHFERWLKNNRCDNWALTDALSCYVIAYWLAQFPQEMRHLVKWTTAKNLWLRRASAVSLVPLAKQSAWHAAAFAQAERLLSEPEDLMHKAVGWLLRETVKADEGAALRKFLAAHGKQMARTSLRYAIECFPAEERKAWLSRTK